MKTGDDKLNKLLKSWTEISPSPAFESNVWRSIRQGSYTTKPGPAGSLHFLLDWAINRPGYLSAAAALVGIATGLTSALAVPALSATRPQENIFQPLPEKSLSSSYAHLVTGEIQ